MYCLQQGLLHMVVVSWAGFGNQATTWVDKQWRPIWATRKARVTPRRLCQVALRANQQQATQHTYLQKALEAESSSAGRLVIRAHSASPAWRMHAAHICCKWRGSLRAPWSTVVTSGKKETIAWCPCTPPTKLETFSEKIIASTCSSKEKAGLKKKKMKTRNRVWANSRVDDWRCIWGRWEHV